ncbi:2-(1,2-epoxy-1,2-dihydrophenyl)acetyl-CoA isomerase [Alteribacillus persepolensis]|uniref:2-(1,2-epoxy-1,2-dihydrophenyl)acetyl-CoA isomerase n=1 Tax=Alteribacillus persepolensis TaxID=568899 RepID=A0A1G8J138_9BACI|nr:enoyl-CoA hydratase/isomerase family protein [Alteribacillus persepolensis]SDI24763.1 2-(1,2-epoxy-1,2-dihydrophenyl)acetyl-CoA isomerase [Alteribacillus persepolensis]
MESVVKTKVSKQIGYMQLNRPDKRNALSAELVEQSIHALQELDLHPEVKAIIITGEGPAFCAGGDIADIRGLNGAGDIAAWMKNAARFTKAIVDLNKYVIAAVHGYAAGAGFSLALASDFIVADRTAKFISSFTNIGLIPDLGLTKLLTERVPLPLAKEWIASGRALSAEELHSKGLINRLSDDDVVKEAEEFSQCIMEGSPLSRMYEKKLLNSAEDLSVDSALLQETITQSLLLNTEDHLEGVAAFLDKRNPAFKGN